MAEDPTERADLAAGLSQSGSRYEHIHERTMHIDPRNVHADDPDGFEQAIERSVELLEKHLRAEDARLREVVDAATPDVRAEMAARSAKAARTASERPHPPRTAVGRMLSNVNVKLDHTLEDVSHPRHPGADTVDGR